MRIAMVYDAVYPYVKGGAERYFAEIAKRLAPRHEVHLFGMKYWSGPADRQQADGVWLHGVCPPVALYRHGRRSLLAALWFTCWLPWSLMRQGRFDIINVNSIPYFPLFPLRLLAALTGATFVVTWLEYWRGHWQQYLGWGATLAGWIEWLATRVSPHAITISEHTRQGILSAGLRAERIALVPPGIDWPHLQAVVPAQETVDILYVGRLIKDKRVDLLLEALDLVRQRRPEIRCLIVGDGIERPSLTALAERLKLNDNVRFAGFLPESDDVYRLMKSSRLFAFLSEREGFGIVVIEAAACGLPVVVVDAPNNAAADLVRSGQFGLISPPDKDRVAGHILALLDNEAQRGVMREKGLACSRNYDWARIAQETERAYQAALSRG